MGKCEFCGKEELLPFRCPYCGKYFCIEHRLPENHNCPEAPARTPLGPAYHPHKDPYALTVPKHKKERKEKIIGVIQPYEEHFERKYTHKNHISKTKIFTVCFVILLVITNFLFWKYYYAKALEISRNQGYEAGYAEGFKAGFSATGYSIRDPTFSEALQFLKYDQTDKNQYSKDYTCWNFAADVKNNAFKAGYRCGLVYIEFKHSAHAIVCFNTTDKGLIFVEPQYDKIVKVEIGMDYWTDNGFNVIVADETITYYAIVW